MRLVEFFEGGILLEDSRGNIKKLLGMSEDLANYFHEISPKFSFAIAKSYKIWLSGEYVHDYGGVNDPAQTRTRGNDEIKQRLQKRIETDIRRFENEVLRGPNGILAMLEDKPHYEKELNKAQTMDDIRKVQSSYMKKKKHSGLGDKVVVDFPDGWYWLRLDPSECGQEGALMQHCASDSRGDLVSLRDEAGNPHVTMTYNKDKNKVFQIKGKQNKAPERKYWDYIYGFWKKLGPQLRDTELTNKSGRIGSEAAELGQALMDLSPVDKRVSDTLDKMIGGVIDDPTIRSWLWNVDLALHRVNRWGNDASEDIVSVKQWFKSKGFESFTVKLGDENHDVYYDAGRWNEEIKNVPPWDQMKTINGWHVISLMKATKKTNNEISKDVVGWVEANRPVLKQVYPAIHRALGLPEDEKNKPIGIKAMNMEKIAPMATPEEYADWFSITRPQKESEWTSWEEFAQANPNIKAGVDFHVQKYLGYSDIKRKYDDTLGSIKSIEKDNVGRFFILLKDGTWREIKPIGAAKKEYYLSVAQRK